jgi:hypothetical protein
MPAKKRACSLAGRRCEINTDDHVRAADSTSNENTSSKARRRKCCLVCVKKNLVMFNLLLCSSAECSSSDVTALRRRRQWSKHRPEHHDQVRSTHSERRCGQGPLHHDQVPAMHKERCRGQRPGHRGQVSVTTSCRLICRIPFSCCGSVAWPQATFWEPGWAPRSRTCDRSHTHPLHLAKCTSHL